MTVALIVAGSVLAGLLLIAFIIWAHQYTKVGPNEVLIISGRRPRKGRPDGRAAGYRIVRGGGTYVRPFREKVERLSLELMQFDVRTGETYSMHGVPLQVDGVCMVKVDPSDGGIQLAAEEFLSRGRDDIARTAQQAVEGHMRAAVGAHSIEDVYRDRAALVAKTKELTAPDLEKMGLDIVSLTIRAIADKQGYLEALGRPRTAEVKRDAVSGEANAEREAKAARYAADTAIEEARRGGSRLRPAAGDHPAGGAGAGAPGRDRGAPEGDRADGGRGAPPHQRARGPGDRAGEVRGAQDRGARRGAQGRAGRAGGRRGRRGETARYGRGRGDARQGERLGQVLGRGDRRP